MVAPPRSTWGDRQTARTIPNTHCVAKMLGSGVRLPASASYACVEDLVSAVFERAVDADGRERVVTLVVMAGFEWREHTSRQGVA